MTKGPSQGGCELVTTLVALLEPQHQFADLKGSTSDSSRVVSAEGLLVLSRVLEGHISGLIQLVQCVFLEHFAAILVVGLYPWRPVLQIRGEDSFRPVDHEERGEACGSASGSP